jgi:ankyrin repeat protein
MEIAMTQTPPQNLVNEFVIAAHHDLPRVQEMLAADPALLNESAEWMETAVQAASHVNRTDIINFLLNEGAPMDICTAAVLGMEDDVASLLIEFPDLVQSTGAHELPVVYFPAIAGHISILSLLITTGADVSAGDGSNTALHGAVASEQVEVVRWLLANDANPYARDHEGRLPIDLAQEKGNAEILALLEPYTAESGQTA